ncbi:GNAT family N-acetyltransferase [Natronococcus sp. A-GB7]|uniref:GNAT family N-acetyltransferase n=1 Tax=Natronococcus sp. A-GB7 TaxID=3037649 RepID=UPI00241FDE09|nr:GNAT family N-acetyltransferase [Natronococcus sp. A-GB7]MDG5821100.1 GNAT family N-acetyltransferase [Natronococcus sp. A-GB7]
MNTASRSTSRVTIRQFEPGDREAFLSLYERVFGRGRSPAWFRWKYEDNPYADHVPIVVAEDDGDLVGCRSLFAQEMRGHGAVRTAYQPCDTMVHPEYRRRGLFDRMNERTLERYAEGGPAFLFNFPNEASKRGNLNHGWREIGTVPLYYRVRDPVGALERWTDGSGAESPVRTDGRAATAAAKSAASRIVEGVHRTGDRLLAPDAEVTLERHESTPAEALAAAYKRAIPEAMHTNRTATFYRWRLANPEHTYTTYVARRDGEPVAALVTATVDDRVRIVEAVPRALEAERRALERLLVAALADRESREFVTAFGETLPRPIRFRFFPDTQAPLSTVIRPSSRTLLARDLDASAAVENSSIDDWTFSRLDLDTT